MEARDFFSKLRSLAITLDKESRQLEQALNNKECDEVTDTEAPLKVLHDMQSEVRALKGEVHAKLSDITLQRNEMNEFIKAAGILRKRAVVDIEKLKAHFQSYGYEAPILKKEIKSLPEEETKQQSIKSTRSVEDISNPEFENVRSFSSPSKKQTASWDSSGSPRTPQLADFGLSHYQFANPWEKLPALPGLSQFSYSGTHKNMLKPVEVKQTVTVPKTPKCTLRLEDEDFTPKLEDFGISENTMCLNADFTMELMKKNNELAKSLAEGDQTVRSSEIINGNSGFLKMATPPSNKYDAILTTSPIPPSFRTPGLKALKGETTVPAGIPKTTEEAILINSPVPPLFCTPGLKVHKKDMEISAVFPDPGESYKSDDLEMPPLPVFETQWLNRDALITKSENKENTLPENTASDKLNVRRAPFVLSSGGFYEELFKPSEPPKIGNYDDILLTPPRPEFLNKLTKDILKTIKPQNEILANKNDVASKISSEDSAGLSLKSDSLVESNNSHSLEDVLKVSSQNEDINCKVLPVKPQEIKKVGDQNIAKCDKMEASRSCLTCLAAVSTDEYLTLPDFVRRQISLDLLNGSIQKINGLLENRSTGTVSQLNASLDEMEVRNLLDAGVQTRMLLLTLTELNRLEEEMLPTTTAYRFLI